MQILRLDKNAGLLEPLHALQYVFSQEDFDAIEREMAKISKENIPLVKKVLPRAEALEFFKEKNQDYKVMLIEDLPEDDWCHDFNIAEFLEQLSFIFHQLIAENHSLWMEERETRSFFMEGKEVKLFSESRSIGILQRKESGL